MLKQEIEECIGLQIRISQGHQNIIDRNTNILSSHTKLIERLYHWINLLCVSLFISWLIVILIGLIIIFNC